MSDQPELFCPKCGKPHATAATFCPSCGNPVATVSTATTSKIVRPRHPRMIAGVCSGVAIHFGWDISVVRILYAVFVCLTFFTGVLLYVGAWIFLPEAPYALPPVINSTF